MILDTLLASRVCPSNSPAPSLTEVPTSSDAANTRRNTTPHPLAQAGTYAVQKTSFSVSWKYGILRPKYGLSSSTDL